MQPTSAAMCHFPPIRIFTILALGGIAAALFFGQWQWREDLMHSGQSGFPPPRPYYGTKAASRVAPEAITGKALGADFAEVYVAAIAAREVRRDGTTEVKPFRPVAYPPLTLWLYGLAGNAPYARVLLAHSLVSVGLFLIAVAAVFHSLGLWRHFWKIGLLTVGVCFYTPAGLSHYERGQFDLYVASAIFLSLAMVYLDRHAAPAALAAGFFGALKLSSLPFLGTFTAAAIATDGRGRRWMYLLVPGMFVLSLVLFFPELSRFLGAMNYMEFAREKGQAIIGERHDLNGVSFQLILPTLTAKGLQIVSLLAFVVTARSIPCPPEERRARFAAAAFPFALAMVVQGMAYGAGSWEYRIVSLLGAAAGFVLWVERVPGLPRIKTAVAIGFALFLLAASRAFHFFIWPKPSWQAHGMSWLYLAFSVACLGVSLWILARSRKMLS